MAKNSVVAQVDFTDEYRPAAVSAARSGPANRSLQARRRARHFARAAPGLRRANFLRSNELRPRARKGVTSAPRTPLADGLLLGLANSRFDPSRVQRELGRRRLERRARDCVVRALDALGRSATISPASSTRASSAIPVSAEKKPGSWLGPITNHRNAERLEPLPRRGKIENRFRARRTRRSSVCAPAPRDRPIRRTAHRDARRRCRRSRTPRCRRASRSRASRRRSSRRPPSSPSRTECRAPTLCEHRRAARKRSSSSGSSPTVGVPRTTAVIAGNRARSLDGAPPSARRLRGSAESASPARARSSRARRQLYRNEGRRRPASDADR